MNSIAPAVYIIGAGPGAPDLLTVKALKILQKADVIIVADSLVPKQMLESVRADAEIIR
ncbi:MAG: precorrin-4 C(11)-methyltransferase, partial [Moorea sp. SIO2I5]|nr:precorrin-4 C(11)-methyltransferase [Moorena sp. SIO2I5]